MDANDILLIAQVGEEVYALGRVAVEDIAAFFASRGGDQAKVAALKAAYAARITREQAQTAPLGD